MNNKDNKPQAVAQITIPVNDRNINVSLANMPTFFESCQNQGLASDVEELNICLEELRDLVIDGASDKLPASELKRPLKFIRELQMFFSGTFYEPSN